MVPHLSASAAPSPAPIAVILFCRAVSFDRQIWPRWRRKMRPRAASPRGLPKGQSASSRQKVRLPKRGVSPGGGGFGPATTVPCVPPGFRRRRQPSTRGCLASSPALAPNQFCRLP
ncbi:hypothetical protein OsJ_28370 [Oryza sativa Japonica Group]|uniref:Uncharacterized protein n=1 Tax=Oryza sativa subsp. japonica TaxID=39947 RepID=B9G243_ORYSJ|nr:hypothetical protein OsJ_28370 [Oryza sativa Japonica Group]